MEFPVDRFIREADIREYLKLTYLKENYTDKGFRVAFEVIIGTARADVVAFKNKSSHCYEIKGESDNMDRLSNQIDNYVRAFDYVTVVTIPKHLDKILQMLPVFIGIMIVTEDGIYEFRKAGFNPCQTNYGLAQVLNHGELIYILEQKGVRTDYDRVDNARMLSFMADRNELFDLAKEFVARRERKERIHFAAPTLFPTYLS